jgi:hypothetical protein
MLRAFLLVIVGLAGDPEHGELFQKWGSTLAGASGRLGVAAERVHYLGAAAEGGVSIRGPATRAGIQAAFATLAGEVTSEDVVFVVLFGHGSFDGRAAKFNLPGPDMPAAEFKPLLAQLPARHVVFVNTASASGPFLEELKALGRTIVTATRSGSEQFATLFGGFFVDALTGEAADANKDRRVSVLEAYEYAKREVAQAYEREGLLSTEHALIEDSGKVAGTLALGGLGDGDAVPTDARLRALHDQRRDIERRIESLKLLKASLDERRYLADLEGLLTELAQKTREIRAAEGKP